jgi:hypothetical protein
MEPPRNPPNPPNLPAVPQHNPPAPADTPPRDDGAPHDPPRYEAPPFEPPRYPPPENRRPSTWARLRARGWRLPIGVGIGGAAVLLIPFFLFPTFDLDEPRAQWWPPFAIGIGALVLLSVLRLDRLLKGWTWHVAGLAFVFALVVETRENPWSWAFAASLAVLLAGLLRLPRWRLAATGAVLCAISVVGFGLRASEVAQQQAEINAQAGEVSRATVGGVPDAQEVLPFLDQSISGPVPDTRLCRIVNADAGRRLTEATGTADCAAAVRAVFARRAQAGGPAPVTVVPRSAPKLTVEPSYVLDGCSTAWAAAAGPQLGRVQVGWTTPTARRYAITGFQPC